MKIILKESAKMFADACVMLFNGRIALNERRLNRLIGIFEAFPINCEMRVANPKLTQLESDISEMAVKIGKPPPRIMISPHPIGMMAPSDNVILISENDILQSSSEELKGLAGHELAHIHRGDHLNFDRPPNHLQELAADRLGAELSGEPDAMISWLERRAKIDPLSAHGTLVYPPISRRIEEILKAGKSKPPPAQEHPGSPSIASPLPPGKER